MKSCPVQKVVLIALVSAVLLCSGYGLAEVPSQKDQAPLPTEPLPASQPDLADIIPLAAQLPGRLARIETRIAGAPDISALEKSYASIEKNIAKQTGYVRDLKNSTTYTFGKVVEIREAIKDDLELFTHLSTPLRQAISELGAWKTEWQIEKKRWEAWKKTLITEEKFSQLASPLEQANLTIDRALELIRPHLGALLTLQAQTGNLEAQLNLLLTQVNALIVNERRGLRINASPPMFSSRFLSQFQGSELWHPIRQGVEENSWLSSRFFTGQGWILLLQALLSFGVIIVVYRKRDILNASKRWRFMAVRPVAAGLFSGVMATMLLYAYEGIPDTWKLVTTLIGGVSFARLSGVLIETPWKRHFVYGLAGVMILNKLMDAVHLPLPLFRLYMLLTAAAGLFFSVRWARQSRDSKNPVLYRWSLWTGACFFVVLIIAELWGKQMFSEYLFTSFMLSMSTVLPFVLFMYMIRGGLEWIFRESPLRRANLLQHSNVEVIINRVAIITNVLIWGLILLPAILMIWGYFPTLQEAVHGVLTLGFNMKSQRVSVGLLIVSTIVFGGSYVLSWTLQKMLLERRTSRPDVGWGARHSVGRLIHYFIVFMGFLLAISILGLDITQFTIILSALGVGIGFGLQGIVNNFISGLILLIERPVRIGDSIEINGMWTQIRRIGLRSTTVQTMDQADMIIPNADLINNPVTNWTLSNRNVRIKIPVGVAYGSDIPLVMKTLTACAEAIPLVSSKPAPQVLFLRFGESTLDFDLRVWVRDSDYRLTVQSELHQEIDRRFREANIEIAFPQRDIHLRSGEKSGLIKEGA